MWRGRPRTEATSEDLLGYYGGLKDMGVSSVEGGGSRRAYTITTSFMKTAASNTISYQPLKKSATKSSQKHLREF